MHHAYRFQATLLEAVYLQLITVYQFFYCNPVIGRVGWNTHNNASTVFRVDKFAWKNGYFPVTKWLCASFPKKLTDVEAAYSFDIFHLVLELLSRVLTYYPPLVIDTEFDIPRVRIEPDICDTVECFRSQSSGGQNILEMGEFYQCEFNGTFAFTAQAVMIACRTLVLRAPHHRMGTLHYVAFFSLCIILPFYEARELRVYR